MTMITNEIIYITIILHYCALKTQVLRYQPHTKIALDATLALRRFLLPVTSCVVSKS